MNTDSTYLDGYRDGACIILDALDAIVVALRDDFPMSPEIPAEVAATLTDVVIDTMSNAATACRNSFEMSWDTAQVIASVERGQ